MEGEMENLLAQVEPEEVRNLISNLPPLAAQRVFKLWWFLSAGSELPIEERFALICSDRTLHAARHSPRLWQRVEFKAASSQARPRALHMWQFAAWLSKHEEALTSLSISTAEQDTVSADEVEALHSMLSTVKGSRSLKSLELDICTTAPGAPGPEARQEPQFADQWLQLPELESLSYSNYGSVLSGSLRQLTNLQCLKVCNMDVSEHLDLPPSLTRLEVLETEEYGGVIVRKIPGGLPQLQALQVVNYPSSYQAGDFYPLDSSALGQLTMLTYLNIDGGGWNIESGFQLHSPVPGGESPLTGLLALKSLRRLHLSCVHVGGGEALDVVGLGCLEEVKLAMCSLPGFRFTGLPILKSVEVQGNTGHYWVEEISTLALHNLPKLESARVGHMRVRTLEMEGLPNLQELDIVDVRLNRRQVGGWEERSIVIGDLPAGLQVSTTKFQTFFTEDGADMAATLRGRLA